MLNCRQCDVRVNGDNNLIEGSACRLRLEGAENHVLGNSNLVSGKNNVIRIKQRMRQSVSSMIEKRNVMLAQQQLPGARNIIVDTVENFPSIFNGKRDNDLLKVRRWWKDKEKILDYASNTSNTKLRSTHVTSQIRKVAEVKAAAGRGPKPQRWVVWLYPQLLEEFERLRATGVQFSKSLLGQLATDIIRRSDHELFHANTRNAKSNKRIIDTVSSMSFVTQFCSKNSIVVRKQTGKVQLSKEKEIYIAKTGVLDENYVENMDETHFVFNMDSGKTLGFIGNKTVKYADVSSGGEGMTMVVRISGGLEAKLEKTMMIFKNMERNYPIKTLPLHEVPSSMAYRTGPKG